MLVQSRNERLSRLDALMSVAAVAKEIDVMDPVEVLKCLGEGMRISRSRRGEQGEGCVIPVQNVDKNRNTPPFETANPWIAKFPSLSLQHSHDDEKDHHQNHHQTSNNRKQVEEHATSLLARPVRLTGPSIRGETTKQGEDHAGTTKGIDLMEKVPSLLLENVYDSFAVLVESRFRAYAVLLAQHGVSLATETPENGAADASGVENIEQKLKTLLKVGNQITVESVSLEFTLEDKEEDKPVSIDDACGEEEEAQSSRMLTRSLPVCFRVGMGLLIPSPTGSDGEEKGGESATPSGIKVPVFVSAKGGLKGSFSAKPNSLLEQVEINLNTNELLSSMVNQAATVVSTVVEMTNNAFCIPDDPDEEDGEEKESTDEAAASDPLFPLRRRDSFLSMPPPLPKSSPSLRPKWELLSYGNSETSPSRGSTVVSPDLSSYSSSAQIIPDLKLKLPGQEEEVKVLSQLSPDECADIVDGVFDESDGSIFDHKMVRPPPAKKVRIE